MESLISKEKYVLNKIKITVDNYIKEDKLINPLSLNKLIEQWIFDYEMAIEYRPEFLKK